MSFITCTPTHYLRTKRYLYKNLSNQICIRSKIIKVFWIKKILGDSDVTIVSVRSESNSNEYRLSGWSCNEMSEEYIILISDVSKAFNHIPALKGINLDIKPGIFGLIGPNGAGKTTLLRICLGLIRLDTGLVSILGLDSQKDSVKIRAKIGVLHEHPYYPKNLRVSEFVEWVKSVRGDSRDTSNLLDVVDLSGVKNKKIGDLSAGMYQRLGLAQALCGDPKIIFLDEPTSNLDVTGRDKIAKLILQLHNEIGVSFFVSSHILSELERVCHSVGFLKEGILVDSGKTRDIIEKHTKGWYRVLTSDPQALLKLLEAEPIFKDCSATDANAITAKVGEEKIEIVRSKVENLVASSDISFYGIEKASSLEEVYRRVMVDEEIQ